MITFEIHDYYWHYMHYIEVPDSPGRIYDESLEEILAAILKCIPECISEADFKRLSDLLPHMEPVYVATRTVQEAIEVNYLKKC